MPGIAQSESASAPWPTCKLSLIVLEGQLTILRASYQQNLVVFFGHVFFGWLVHWISSLYLARSLSLSLSTWLLAAFCATKRPAEKNIHHIYAYLALIIWTDSPHYGHHVTSLWSGHCIHCHAYTSIRHPFTFTGAIVRIHDIESYIMMAMFTMLYKYKGYITGTHTHTHTKSVCYKPIACKFETLGHHEACWGMLVVQPGARSGRLPTEQGTAHRNLGSAKNQRRSGSKKRNTRPPPSLVLIHTQPLYWFKTYQNAQSLP